MFKIRVTYYLLSEDSQTRISDLQVAWLSSDSQMLFDMDEDLATKIDSDEIGSLADDVYEQMTFEHSSEVMSIEFIRVE